MSYFSTLPKKSTTNFVNIEMAIFVFILLQAVLMAHGEMCTGPSVSTDIYTTKHIALSSETAHVVEFTVNCKEEDVKGIN